jgi:hypothetical protein
VLYFSCTTAAGIAQYRKAAGTAKLLVTKQKKPPKSAERDARDFLSHTMAVFLAEAVLLADIQGLARYFASS